MKITNRTTLLNQCHIISTNNYRPRSEASEGYVFTGICLSIEVLYSGKQTDTTAIDFQPIGDRLTNELWDFKVQWQWCLSVYHHGRAVRILLECILVLFLKTLCLS